MLKGQEQRRTTKQQQKKKISNKYLVKSSFNFSVIVHSLKGAKKLNLLFFS